MAKKSHEEAQKTIHTNRKPIVRTATIIGNKILIRDIHAGYLPCEKSYRTAPTIVGNRLLRKSWQTRGVLSHHHTGIDAHSLGTPSSITREQGHITAWTCRSACNRIESSRKPCSLRKSKSPAAYASRKDMYQGSLRKSKIHVSGQPTQVEKPCATAAYADRKAIRTCARFPIGEDSHISFESTRRKQL